MIKNTNAWDEAQVVSTVKNIMNHYMGVPPESFPWKGTRYTQKEFLFSYLKLQMMDFLVHKDAIRDMLEKFPKEGND
ncbi:MAG: hypothetical protein Q8M08_03290 [Bacteroidales bacterium]|nr:hypothetical protein [Bacteroidales bacterium]